MYDQNNQLDVSDVDFRKSIKEDYEEVFDEDETSRMMNYLIENLDIMNLEILLMFVSGVRIGELVTLRFSDFTDDGTVNIRRTETKYYSEELGKYVYEVKEFPKCEYVFAKNGARIRTVSMRRRLDRLCNRLHIYHKSPHIIRKNKYV